MQILNNSSFCFSEKEEITYGKEFEIGERIPRQIN